MARLTSKPELTDADRALYPTHLLEGCHTGLCLFAAAFLGLNDAAHFEEAGLRTTCVDNDAERLGQMSFYYRNDWRFWPDDAWVYAEEAVFFGVQFDAVSVDPFTGESMDLALYDVPLWAALARKFVTVGIPAGPAPEFTLPMGEWKSYVHPRSATASWLVLERA